MAATLTFYRSRCFLPDAVTLPYEYNMISIDFAATNMALPAKNFINIEWMDLMKLDRFGNRSHGRTQTSIPALTLSM